MGRLNYAFVAMMLMAGPAWATCPVVATDCPSPVYKKVTAGTSFNVVGNSTAALSADAAGLDVQLNGAVNGAQIFQNIIHVPQALNVDAVRGAVTNTSGSTIANANGIAGYVWNQAATSTPAEGVLNVGHNGVSLYGVGIGAADNSHTWGVNTNLTDSNSAGVTTGTGRQLINEFDFNVTSPNTQINGILLQGASVAQPNSANGFIGLPLSIGAFTSVWTNMFYSGNGAAQTAMYAGTKGNPAVANQPSQPIAFIYTNASAAQQVDQIYATTSGLIMSAPAIVPTPMTVATLPTCNATSSGAFASVTNALSPTYNGTLTAGGAVHVPVYCNGTAWVTH